MLDIYSSLAYVYSIMFTQMKVIWKPKHEEMIKRNFHSKASHRLSEMFMIARKNEKKPTWMFDSVWESLLSKWNSVTYRVKCSQAQQHRRSEIGGSLHTGGCISRYEHAIRMVSILNITSFYFFL